MHRRKNEISTNDGMDVSILSICANNELHCAGANRPLLIFDQNDTLHKIDWNKYPVVGNQLDANRIFTTHKYQPTGSCMLYISSDGYADQYGGNIGKKFMVSRYYRDLQQFHLQHPDQ